MIFWLVLTSTILFGAYCFLAIFAVILGTILGSVGVCAGEASKNKE